MRFSHILQVTDYQHVVILRLFLHTKKKAFLHQKVYDFDYKSKDFLIKTPTNNYQKSHEFFLFIQNLHFANPKVPFFFPLSYFSEAKSVQNFNLRFISKTTFFTYSQKNQKKHFSRAYAKKLNFFLRFLHQNS